MTKYLILALLALPGCAMPQLDAALGATTHRYDGKTWSVLDRPGQLAIVAVSGGVTDPEREHRAAALDYLLRGQRGCSLGNGGISGEGRYVFDYACD